MKKEFTKSDLKDGMVVEYRNGYRRIIQGTFVKGFDGCNPLYYYNKDLKNTDENGIFKELDIVKVYDDTDKLCTLKEMLENPKNLIWERKEEPVTKDVSLEEINALLKEKYPDVEKFNLSIDNDK